MHTKVSGLKSSNIRRNSQTEEEDMDQAGLFSATSRNSLQNSKRMRNSSELGGSRAKKAKMSYSEDNVTELTELGRFYESKKDVVRAVYYYEKAAKFNGEDALYYLGVLYYNVKSIKNINKAIHYLEKSVVAENYFALRLLIHLYREEQSVKDLHKARSLMEKAVKFGDTESKMLVDFLNGLDELKISKNIKMRQQFSIIIKTLNIFIGDKAVEDFINSEQLEKVCNWNGVVISILQSKCAEFLKQNLRLLNELGSFLEKSISIGMSHPSMFAGIIGETKSRLIHISTLLDYYDCHLDFSNIDLQKIKLPGSSTIDLTKVNLTGANLTGAELHNVKLSINQWYQLRLQKVTLTNFIISYESCIKKLYQVYKLIHAKTQGESPFDFLPAELKIFQLILLQKSIIQDVQDNKGTIERKSEFEGWMQLYG